MGKKVVVVKKKFRVTKIITTTFEIKRYEVKSSLFIKLDSFRAPFLKEIVAFIIHDNKRWEIDLSSIFQTVASPNSELLDLHFLMLVSLKIAAGPPTEPK